MLQKTAQYMKIYRMAEPGEKLVVGLSGGMDSVCLFHVLCLLGYETVAVHVHHGIRGAEADRDEAFVRRLCEKYGAEFYGYRFDVPKLSRMEHLSVEEEGRKVRRQAFFEVMEKTGAGHIALAHHGNDRAETMLFHLSRGTGIRGLASMRPCEGKLIRPFLWAERSDIEAYAAAQRLEWVEDGTNASTEYTRNKLRHEIMPRLLEINPKSVAHFGAAADKLAAVSDYMEREADKAMRQCAVCTADEVRITKKPFLEADEVLRIPVLQKCMERLSGSLADITQEHFEKLRDLFELQTGRRIDLPYRLAAERTYEGIRLFMKKESEKEAPLHVTGAGIYHFGGRTVEICIEEWDKDKIFPIKTYTKCFDYDKIKDSIFLRTRQRGDYLTVNKEGGRKLLQDYFVNEKVPKEKRDDVLLLADGSHILWVVGKRISEYYKVTEETKRVLKVRSDGGDEYGLQGE